MSQLLAILNREQITMPRGIKTIHRIETDADSKPSIPERQASEAEIIARENSREAVTRAINEGKHSITGIADHLGETRGKIRHIIVGMKADGLVTVTNVTGRPKTRFHVELKK